MRIIVASTNPVKIAAAKNGFQRFFPDAQIEINGVSAPSGVPDQPMTFAQGMDGARNRVAHIRTQHPDADYWVAFEGAIEDVDNEMRSRASVVVASQTYQSEETSASFRIPPAVAARVRAGMELGQAHDEVFGRVNSKQQMGMVGELTDNHIDRTVYYHHAMMLALIPFVHPELYI